jgi:hypothetical protein
MRNNRGNAGPLVSFTQQNVSPTGAITALTIAVTLASYLVAGCEVGDQFIVAPVATVANVTPGAAYCLVAGTMIVGWVNPTAGNIGPFAGVLNVTVMKGATGEQGPGA